ncbi:MAG: recombination protein O N-terminal domain-containing protein [Candidatus Paceibacterota bacterium]
MRHKYETAGIVLARSPLGEANTLVTLLTPSLGLVRARAQGLRKPEAKLAAALVTFAESDLVLVRGKEGWRVAGAVLATSWFTRMCSTDARVRAARVSGLLTRLVAGEEREAGLYPIVQGFFKAFSVLPEALLEEAELLVVLRVLSAMGLDAGELPEGPETFSPETLAAVSAARVDYIARINNGIAASGL